MLTDGMLKEATGKVVEFRVSSYEYESEPHLFSHRFQQKMEKLIRRTEHPWVYRTLRTAAAIVVTLATLFGGILAVSPEVRAEVTQWLQRVFTLSYETENDTPVTGEYTLVSVPDGYEAYNTLETANAKHYNYVKEDGKMLTFSYKYPMGSGGISITGNYEHRTELVNGVHADVYISPDGSEASYIVWDDPETGAILWIKAWESEKTLIQLARAVEKIKG